MLGTQLRTAPQDPHSCQKSLCKLKCPSSQTLHCPLTVQARVRKTTRLVVWLLHCDWALCQLVPSLSSFTQNKPSVKTPRAFYPHIPKIWPPQRMIFTCGNFPCSLLIEHINTKTDNWFCPPSIHLPLSANSILIFFWETTSSPQGGSFRGGHMTQAWPIKAFLLARVIGSGMNTGCKPSQWNLILGLLLELLQIGHIFFS